jgi:protein involved in plasmid replication-relaxation
VSGVGIHERAMRAGDGLAEHTIIWAERAGRTRSVALTLRDLRLMALLYEVNFLSASQLMLLGWGRQSNAASRRLRLLHGGGYLDRFRAPARAGSNEWIYRVTRRGWQAVADRGLTSETRYQTMELHSISYAEHDLQLNALILCIAQAAAPSGDTGLIDRLPFTWIGPRTGRIDPSRTIPAEPSDTARLPPDTQLHPEQSRPGHLEPDATLTAGTPGQRFAVLIEYDRTARPHKQLDRLRRYDHWLLDGWRHTPFATHAIPPAVLFITAHEPPLKALIQTADRTLSAWHGPRHATASEGTHPARQRILFTSRASLLADSWVMRRASSLPATLRPSADGAPRAIDYDLPTLLEV